MLDGEERRQELQRAADLPSVILAPRAMCDLELMATGAFSPLDRFMGRADYERVLDEMRLADGTVYPVPVTLPLADPPEVGKDIVLRNPNNVRMAILRVEEVFEWDRDREARQVCRTNDGRHPLVAEMASWGRYYASGPLKVLNLPSHQDFPALRKNAAEVRAELEELGNTKVVAFHTRTPIHRIHEEITRKAVEQVGANLLVQPVVGMTRPGDMDHYTRVRTYLILKDKYYDPRRTVLSLLPLAVRHAGPREAVWHAIIRRNFGATHLIVGRDYASAGVDSKGRLFFGSLEAQELMRALGPHVGVTMVPYEELVYLPDEDRYEVEGQVPPGRRTLSISGTDVRNDYLAAGKPLPNWFTRPEVAEVLARAFPPRHQQGFCIWFTGLPSSGKSTIAEVLAVLLMERGRQVTLLDGDVVRTHLSKGLGFSQQDRDTNILRIGFVASEIARHHGAVISSAVSPYRSTRDQVRAMVGEDRFIVVYVNTPIEICEQRDVKGYYGRARAGEIHGFTGVDDPYEAPANPEITLTTTDCTPEQNAQRIVGHMREKGFLPA